MKDFQKQIEEWERVNLNSLGKYTGVPLRYYAYERGEYIPVEKRYSAMLAWKYLTGNNPANPERAKPIKAEQAQGKQEIKNEMLQP